MFKLPRLQIIKHKMISLLKYTYLMQTGKIDQELSNLWTKYQKILNNPNATWDDINEARAILFTTGNIYLEQIASEAIEKRLKHLKEKFTILEFLSIIDSNSPKLERLRECPKFKELETFYLIIKKHKNKYSKGKFYLDEEQFIEKHKKLNPSKESEIGYKGYFDKHFLN